MTEKPIQWVWTKIITNNKKQKTNKRKCHFEGTNDNFGAIFPRDLFKSKITKKSNLKGLGVEDSQVPKMAKKDTKPKID